MFGCFVLGDACSLRFAFLLYFLNHHILFIFNLGLSVPLHTYFVDASSERSSEVILKHRLTGAFAIRSKIACTDQYTMGDLVVAYSNLSVFIF